MPNQQKIKEIKCENLPVKEIFKSKWFNIPEYQRPYIWQRDQVDDLLDDLIYAWKEKPHQSYFLGSFVYQIKEPGHEGGQKFLENDLLDGQQRITTLLMLEACIRDLSCKTHIHDVCQEAIFQKGNPINRVPERTRIAFPTRDEVQEFFNQFIKQKDGTKREQDLHVLVHNKEDTSVRNMAQAVLRMREYLGNLKQNSQQEDFLEKFLGFIQNNVCLIFVATETIEDAFRLFTILNNRGMPLRNSDILKSQNLGALDNKEDKVRYAKKWEAAESELGDDFDRFLSHVRTILVKEKARLSLLEEYNQKIYRKKDKAIKPLLHEGKDTFDTIERYLEIYKDLLDGNNYDRAGKSFEFDNLIKVMRTGLPSSDWVPPLLSCINRFNSEWKRILEFLVRLDKKFSVDWVTQCTPTERLENMNKIIRVVEEAQTIDEVLKDACFTWDSENFNRIIDGVVYGRRFTRYLLLKLDYLYQDHSHQMTIENLSVEHVLPQNPEDNSRWKQDFDDDQRKEWTDRLGNLVLISSRKNTSLGRLDFAKKKIRYFEERISNRPYSLRVFSKNSQWTPTELSSNHEIVLSKLREHYGMQAPGYMP